MSPLPPLSLPFDPQHPPTLLEVMAALEAGGWDYRFTSRVEYGTRLYKARVWLAAEKTGVSGTSGHPQTHTVTDGLPNHALARAWLLAVRSCTRWERTQAKWQERAAQIAAFEERNRP